MTFSNNVDQCNPRFALSEAEELQLAKFFMDRAVDAVYWVNSKAQCLYVNHAACCISGYSREELLLTSMLNFFQISVEIWLEHWRTIKQQGSFSFKSIHQTKQGWNPVEIAVIYVEHYGREYGCTFVRDRVQHQQLENTLHKYHEPLQGRTVELKTVVEQLKPLEPLFSFPKASKLAEVFDFIESNYHKQITLNDVAEFVGYSPTYLTNLIGQETGNTIYMWIVKRRMAAACSLLLETQLPVNQIAEAVGYRDASYFSRQFRQIFSMSPKDWRRNGGAECGDPKLETIPQLHQCGAN